MLEALAGVLSVKYLILPKATMRQGKHHEALRFPPSARQDSTRRSCHSTRGPDNLQFI
jgi:hypothetical protein